MNRLDTHVKHGYHEEYHHNGIMSGKGHYNMGLKEGYWETYYDAGVVMWKGNFNRGRMCGHWIGYYTDGELSYDGHYDNNGKRIGYWLWNWMGDGNDIIQHESFYL